MVNRKIRLSAPTVDKLELVEIKKLFNKSWLGYGPNVLKFEKAWSRYFGSKYSLGLNSCTAALHISLAVNNFKKTYISCGNVKYGNRRTIMQMIACLIQKKLLL